MDNPLPDEKKFRSDLQPYDELPHLGIPVLVMTGEAVPTILGFLRRVDEG